MSRLRALLVALTIMAMAVAPLLVSNIGFGSPTSSPAYAAIAAAPMNQNAGANDNDGDNDDDDDNNNTDGDDNENDDGDDDGDDNENKDDDDGDDDPGPVSPAPARSAAASAPPASVCSTPGQEMSFQTADGRITVRVFGSMTQSLKFSIRHPIDPASVPPAPGPVVGGLFFQLIAETCDGSPVAVLPAEVNLGVRYEDADAAGLNEANFALARLDTSANQWSAVQKQAPDPPNNYTSATITEMGFYVLHQRP